ncbi:MAG: XkdF-like putative serine protease domain-containing protein [Promethearchaeota archaeon]
MSTKYKVQTENGIEFIKSDNDQLEVGDKGFSIKGKYVKVGKEANLFTVVDKGEEVTKADEEDIDESYDLDEVSKSDEKQFVLGKVLIPDKVDSQKDILRKEEIEKAAWRFMRNSHAVGYRHTDYAPNSYIVESYIAPVDMEINENKIKKGTWMLGVKVENDELWKEIKNNKLSAFSIGGYGRRIPINEGE